MGDLTAEHLVAEGTDRQDGFNRADRLSDDDINAELDADMAEALEADAGPEQDRGNGDGNREGAGNGDDDGDGDEEFDEGAGI